MAKTNRAKVESGQVNNKGAILNNILKLAVLIASLQKNEYITIHDVIGFMDMERRTAHNDLATFHEQGFLAKQKGQGNGRGGRPANRYYPRFEGRG